MPVACALACTHSHRPASIRDHLHQNASGSHHTRFPSCALSVTCPCPLAPPSPSHAPSWPIPFPWLSPLPSYSRSLLSPSHPQILALSSSPLAPSRHRPRPLLLEPHVHTSTCTYADVCPHPLPLDTSTDACMRASQGHAQAARRGLTRWCGGVIGRQRCRPPPICAIHTLLRQHGVLV
jgi:hypothetical protein